MELNLNGILSDRNSYDSQLFDETLGSTSELRSDLRSVSFSEKDLRDLRSQLITMRNLAASNPENAQAPAWKFQELINSIDEGDFAETLSFLASEQDQLSGSLGNIFKKIGSALSNGVKKLAPIAQSLAPIVASVAPGGSLVSKISSGIVKATPTPAQTQAAVRNQTSIQAQSQSYQPAVQSSQPAPQIIYQQTPAQNYHPLVQPFAPAYQPPTQRQVVQSPATEPKDNTKMWLIVGGSVLAVGVLAVVLTSGRRRLNGLDGEQLNTEVPSDIHTVPIKERSDYQEAKVVSSGNLHLVGVKKRSLKKSKAKKKVLAQAFD